MIQRKTSPKYTITKPRPKPLGRPKDPTSKIPLSLRVPPDDMAWLTATAQATGRTVTDLVIEAIEMLKGKE